MSMGDEASVGSGCAGGGSTGSSVRRSLFASNIYIINTKRNYYT